MFKTCYSKASSTGPNLSLSLSHTLYLFLFSLGLSLWLIMLHNTAAGRGLAKGPALLFIMPYNHIWQPVFLDPHPLPQGPSHRHPVFEPWKTVLTNTVMAAGLSRAQEYTHVLLLLFFCFCCHLYCHLVSIFYLSFSRFMADVKNKNN